MATDEAQELHQLIKELGLPHKAIIECGLGITSQAFYLWRGKQAMTPPDRRQQMRDMIDTLRHWQEKGVLPVNKNMLVWEGLLAITDRAKG